MNPPIDGPASRFFTPLTLQGDFDQTLPSALSEKMRQLINDAPQGSSVSWGIPFEIGKPILLTDRSVAASTPPFQARWLVFLHTSDRQPLQPNSSGFFSPIRGEGQLNEHAADYIVLYADGSEERAQIRLRHQVGSFERSWGENCLQAVEHHKPHPIRASHEQTHPEWGWSQTRVSGWSYGPWVNWVWAWQNPHPEKTIHGLRFEPLKGALVISAITSGQVTNHPLRWEQREKAILLLPEGTLFQPELDENGLLSQIQLDLGQVISAQPRTIYPEAGWQDSYNNQIRFNGNWRD